MNPINTREDLDALIGTPEYEVQLAVLAGTLWRIERDADGKWRAVEDNSTLERFGLSREDFPDATPPELPVDTPVSAEQADALVATKIEGLWQAADRYTSSYISGVAVGILTLGVLQQKPKALAVTAWSSAIWAEYYARKALVTVDSQDNHDFTGFGPMPHSVPELQAEIGL